MALSMATAVNKMAQRISEVTGVARVHSWGLAEADDATYPGVTRIPEAINEWPAIVVAPAELAGSGYILSAAHHRHTYNVSIEVYEGRGDIGIRAATAAPFLDRLIEKLVGNVSLGGTVNSCIFKSWRATSFDFGGAMHTGFAITVEVSEEASAATAVGS